MSRLVSARLASWVMYLGMTVAMAGGAPWPRPNWIVVTAGLAVIGLGVALKALADKRGPAAGEEGEARVGTLAAAGAALPAMLDHVRKLAQDAPTMSLPALAQAIDAIQATGTEAFVASQDAIVRTYSFPGYATVVAPLATGERLLYRAWSAASDGHRPEALASIEAAMPHLDEAMEAWRVLLGPRAKAPAAG